MTWYSCRKVSCNVKQSQYLLGFRTYNIVELLERYAAPDKHFKKYCTLSHWKKNRKNEELILESCKTFNYLLVLTNYLQQTREFWTFSRFFWENGSSPLILWKKWSERKPEKFWKKSTTQNTLIFLNESCFWLPKNWIVLTSFHKILKNVANLFLALYLRVN